MSRHAPPACCPQPCPTPALALLHLRLQCHETPGDDPSWASLRRVVTRWLQRLRAPARAATAGWPALAVSIRALDGHVLLTRRLASADLDVSVPPGTYHVSVHRGDACRLYTVTLPPAADIRLLLVPPPWPS